MASQYHLRPGIREVKRDDGVTVIDAPAMDLVKRRGQWSLILTGRFPKTLMFREIFSFPKMFFAFGKVILGFDKERRAAHELTGL